MHWDGHAGLTLIIFSILLAAFGYNLNVLFLLAIALVVSFVPDFDLDSKYFDHRGRSHSGGVAIIVGLVFGSVMFYVKGLTWGLLGFFGG
ncbi:hypothetical protein AKJ40_01165, partial [candidate division MSBL1 archaeon SCGC-AAA259M10]